MIYRSEKKPAIVSSLFAFTWAAYLLFIMPFADLVTDECSGTPSHNFTNAIFIVPFYFGVFGYWIFQIFGSLKNQLRLLISALLLLLLPILLALIINFIALHSTTVKLVAETNLFDLLYRYGCYQELEVKAAPLTMISALLIGFILYFTLTILRKNEAQATRKKNTYAEQ